jgi:hypothetical protein
MKKNKAIALAVFLMGIVALAGSLFVLTMLFEVGAMFSSMTDTAEGAMIAPMMGMISGFLLFGWLWSICVLVASGYAIYASYKALREK